MVSYLRAVQERDTVTLLDLAAAYVLEQRDTPEPDQEALQRRYEAMVDARYEGWMADRDEGRLQLDPDGIALIRALKLGRGAYYETVASGRTSPERAFLVHEVRLAYRSIDLSGLPAGTTIYLLGAPLGTVHHPVIGKHEPAGRRLLDRLWIRWDLVQVDDRWLVESVGADPDRPPLTYDDTTRY